MADDLYSLITGARHVAATGAANVFGVEIAIVTGTQDPEKQGRVKLCFPRLSGLPEGTWARVAQPAAGSGRGFYWLPEVNDEVLVAFEMGQTNRPYVVGCLWNGKDKPMQAAYTDDNTTRMIQSKSGHQILLSDKDGEEKIVIADGSGKRLLTFDVKAKKLFIEAKEGSVEVRAKKKIVLACSDLEVKTSKSGKLDVGSTMDLKVSGDVRMEAGSKFTLQGSEVQINPSALNLAELAAAALRAAARAAAAAAAAAAGAPAGAGAGSGAAAGGAAGGPSGAPGGAGPAGRSSVVPSQDVVGPGGASPAGGGAAPAGSAAAAGGGAAPAPAQADTPTSPAAAVGPGQIQVQIVSVAGKAQGGLEFEIVAPDGAKHAGKTDAQGSLRVDGLPQSGECTLDLPDIKPAPAADPSVQGRLRFVDGGIKVKIGAASVVEVPPRVRRCRLSGLNFETNKTFLRPEAMTGIRQLVKLYTSFEGIQGLVNGHTDKQPPKSGDAFEFNRKLSLERAEAMGAYLTDDAEAWQKFYAGTGASGQWGVREDQLMLSTVKDSAGAPFYDGEIDGKPGTKTKAAYRSFQRSRLIDEKDAPTPQMRRELVRAYMKLDGTSLPKDSKLEFHGCGQTHPSPETEGDPNLTPEQRATSKIDQPKNRRVEVYLFDGPVDPSPVDPEPRSGCEQHAKWVERMILDVDLDRPPGTLNVRVVDETGAAIDGAHVHASGPLVQDASAPASFADLVPGTYKVIADADDFGAADATTEVLAGGAAEVTLTLKPAGLELEVKVEDDRTPPAALPDAEVTLDVPGVPAGKTDSEGRVLFKGLKPGKVHINARHLGFFKGEADVDVGAPPAQTRGAAAFADAAPAQKKPAAQKTLPLARKTLTVKFAMLFASRDNPAVPRWDKGIHGVEGAKVELVDPIGVVESIKPKEASNAAGVLVIDLSTFKGENGAFTLKISPPDGKASTGPAGVDTPPGIDSAASAQNAPDLLFRPFEVDLTLDDAGVTAASVHVPPSPEFARVASFKPAELVLDWHPDWMKRVMKPETIGGAIFRRAKKLGPDKKATNEDLIDLLVLHQTSAPEEIGPQINTLVVDKGDPHAKRTNPETKQEEEFKRFAAAAHYLVDTDGHALKIVHERVQAVHAEPGFWERAAPENVLNDRSIGIEIVHSDRSGPHPFTEEQYTTLLRLVGEIQARFPDITRQRVVGHSDVDLAGNRLGDPGPMFEWTRFEEAPAGGDVKLARRRVGPPPAAPYRIATGGKLDKANAKQVGRLQRDLKSIGYRMTDAAGTFGKDTLRAVSLFQRHWFARPHTFPKEGEVDLQTAQAIVQVVSDGGTAAPDTAEITSLTVMPSAGSAPVKAQRDAPGERADDSEPIEAVVVQEAEQVRVSWTVEGSPEGLRLDPGGHDVAGLTKDGQGSIELPIKREDAADGFITFKVTLGSPPPARSGEAAPLADQQAAPGTSMAQQAVIAHKIPPLPADPITGSKFIDSVKDLDADPAFSKLPAREQAAMKALLAGNVPTFLRAFVPIDLTFKGPSGKTHKGQVYVSPDVLAIGTDADFVRWPMTPLGAQQVLDAFGCTFVTAKISDAIFNAKGCKQLTMHSHTEWVKDPDPKKTFGFLMKANAQYVEMNKRIDADLGKAGQLVAGHKKDVILHKFVASADQPAKGRRPVIIYGCKFQGKFPFQDPFPGHHADDYEDYSHGIRLLSQHMLVEGDPKTVFEVLRDKELFGLLTAANIFEDSGSRHDADFPLRYPGQLPTLTYPFSR